MHGLFWATRLIGALFAQVALATALLAMLGPLDMAGGALGLRARGAEAAVSQPAQTAEAAIFSAEIIVFAPRAMGAEVLDIAARAQIDRAAPRMRDADFARLRSGLQLSGAAASWWTEADQIYARSPYPDIDAVLVIAAPDADHVAVVARVLNPRELPVDHADWRRSGQIVRGVLVRDVSGVGDWSAVRIWDAQAGALERRIYPARGFIHPRRIG